jgi:hypothetical protein
MDSAIEVFFKFLFCFTLTKTIEKNQQIVKLNNMSRKKLIMSTKILIQSQFSFFILSGILQIHPNKQVDEMFIPHPTRNCDWMGISHTLTQIVLFLNLGKSRFRQNIFEP